MTRTLATIAMSIVVSMGCVPRFPENPTPEQLDEMHGIMTECLDQIIPLEKRYSRKCRSVEDALIAYYGSLNGFMEAHRNRR